MTSTILKRLPEGDRPVKPAEVNRWLDVLGGLLGGGLLMRGHDGTRRDNSSSTNAVLDMQSSAAGVPHQWWLLSTASPTATPTAANAHSIQDAGLEIGAGGHARIYGPSGTGYGQFTSDNNGKLTLAGSGVDAGTLSLSALAGLTSISLGATPATTGAIRLSNTTRIVARNAANSGDIALLDTSGDVVQVGQTGNRLNLLGTVFAPGINPPTIDGQVTSKSQVKGWVEGTISLGTLTVGESYNATASRLGAGNYTITWTRAFASATYAVVVTPAAVAASLLWTVTGKLAGSCTINFSTTGGVATDPSGFSVMAFGTLI